MNVSVGRWPDRRRGELAVRAYGDVGAAVALADGADSAAVLGPGLVPPEAGEPQHLELLQTPANTFKLFGQISLRNF